MIHVCTNDQFYYTQDFVTFCSHQFGSTIGRLEHFFENVSKNYIIIFQP